MQKEKFNKFLSIRIKLKICDTGRINYAFNLNFTI